MFQRLRLLFCCFDFVPTASMLSRRISCYIKALSGNFDVSLLCIKDSEHPHIERYEKARILRVPLKRGTLKERIEQFERAVRRQLESEEYVVAHSFDLVSGQILAELKKQLGYHLVFEAATLCSQEWPYSQPEFVASPESLETIKSAEKHVALNSNAIIVATQQQKNHLLSQGLDSIPIHILLTPALPYKKISPRPTGYFQFLHLGGETQLASVQTTLNALKTIPQELKFQLSLGGYYSANSKAHLTRLKETLHAKRTVLWPSLKHGIEEVRVLFTQANAALLALEYESRNMDFGSSMPELADFCTGGLPIIASELPCVRELLGQDEALFFEPGNSTMLAERMKELAASSELQARLSAASLEKAAAFKPSLFVDEVLRLYNQWVDKPVEHSEQVFEPLPDITPSMAKTTSHHACPPSSLEQDTVLVTPASFSRSPE